MDTDFTKKLPNSISVKHSYIYSLFDIPAWFSVFETSQYKFSAELALANVPSGESDYKQKKTDRKHQYACSSWLT